MQLILKADAGLQVETQAALIETLRQLLQEPEQRQRLIVNGQRLMAENQGAKDKAIQLIQSAIS